MQKYIYKITNLINNKVYIGQTNDLQRRKKEHFILQKEKDKLLYHAIQKYGVENFSFECIEDLCEDYNEKEKYWIKFYHSYIGDKECNGYNLTEGGEEPPILRGEKNPGSTHSDITVDLIVYYLLETNLSSSEIGEITGYDKTSITKINNGLLRKKDSLVYPLRKSMSQIGLNERADLIINDLLYTDLTQKEIGEKYGLGRTAITAINTGANHRRENIDYPIRKNKIRNGSKPKKVIMLDIDSLKEIRVFDSVKEAAKFLNKDRGDVISTAIKNNKTCWGYKWKYLEE